MKIRFIILLVFAIVFISNHTLAQGPMGRDFGFGLILGDPTGGTIKYWFSSENALVVSIGGSYFGSPRINAEYLWHFDAFNSQVVKLYAGIGGVIGFGEGRGWFRKHDDDDFWYRKEGTGLAIRAIFGLNIIPRRTPLEIFAEAGPLIGVSPDFGSALDVSVGIRFYP